MSAIDEYLEKVSPAQQAEFERVRRIVRQLVPEAEETISYGMPTFKYQGKYLIYFGAFKNHMTIFPGTIKFTADNPIPESTLREKILDRVADLSKG
jgi:uncharacterized protein YdhG (YjbR/CyaY superfamily)